MNIFIFFSKSIWKSFDDKFLHKTNTFCTFINIYYKMKMGNLLENIYDKKKNTKSTLLNEIL